MSVWNNVKRDALLKCKRYCCYCEQYKGTNIEVHHIVQRADGGKDTFDNAIPLCFDCHSEIGSYNPKHPKGNKFSTNELKQIRDMFYLKVANIPRKASYLSEFDKNLLNEFKNDYVRLIEYAIHTDFSSELVDVNYSDKIYYLEQDKWCRKNYIFENTNLDNTKVEILSKLKELRYYLSDRYLRHHEGSGMLIFRNQSFEEGCQLRDELRPETFRIRKELYNLLEQIYMY